MPSDEPPSVQVSASPDAGKGHEWLELTQG
jgi:hypothetical protein